MLPTNRKIVATLLLAAGIAAVGAVARAQSSAADDEEKAREAVRAAEAQLRAAEEQLKRAQANYEHVKNVQGARTLRERLQSVEWELTEVRASGGGAFTLRLNHFQRLMLDNLPVARDVRVIIDEGTGKLADLRVGMRLGLRLAADDLVITEIDAHSPEELSDYLVKEVDVAKGTLSVTRAGKAAGKDFRQDFLSGLHLDDDVQVHIENEARDVTDLKPGMRVALSIEVSSGRLVVVRIQARK
jgi:multidrug efflux pump subunit AcrA (membrane-fusion protein)